VAEFATGNRTLNFATGTNRDTAAVFAMGSDPEVTRYGSELPWTDTAQADARIVRSIHAVTCGEYLPLVMERREDGAVIGECGLYQWSLQNRRAELGYRMNRAFWGKPICGKH
jgi:RimJ/RimL family protein N-acetyltransferase